MKISATKKAAILATVLGGFVLGSSAEAANLGVVTASDYVTSHMGALQGSYINSDDIKAVKSVISGLNGDPAVYNTVDPITGKSSLYIRQYTYSTVNLQNSFAFDAQGDWNNRVAGSVSEATNAHDVARYKDFVYVASYDEGTIGVGQVTDTVISDKTAFTRNLKEDLKLFGSDEVREVLSDSRASLHGEGVVIIDGSLYVVANVNPKGGYDPYSPSYLIKYIIKENGSLSYDGYTTMGKNTDSVALNVYNNYMLATAIGGYQYYGAENSNADTSIDVVTLNPENKRFMDTRQITLPENLLQVRDGKPIPKSEFRSLKVLPNGTAYVMTYNIGKAGKNVDVTVYQTTVSNLLSTQPQNWKEVYREEAAPGWFGRLDAEYNTKRLWVQVGNKLHIYTDGATDPKVFGTDSFAANKMYEELYTWDIISTDVIPEGGLVKLHITKGNVQPVEWKVVAIDKNIGQIKNETYKNIETKDNLISLNQDAEGNLTNNVLSGIYADGVNSTIIANDGLQIQVDNNIASPVGIYAGNGGSVKFTSTSGNLDVLTKTLDGGNTLTNAIWLDPSKNGGEKLQITAANTNITMEGGYGGNGIAIQKTDRWGENSKESTQGGKITITGNLNIKGANVDADNNKVADWGIQGNPTNVLSRFNNAGILVDVNNSSVEVNGNVDMDVYGNGVTVTGDNSIVTIAKGGSITVPTGTKYGYYALAAYDGTINMNADATANAVKLNGDIFATSEGTINLGLATKDSYLNGIIDNGGNAENNGAVNVIIKNGATWTNVANNDRYYQDNEDKGSNGRSHVTKLQGGTSFDDAGTIIQTENSQNLWIDVLDGALKVNYVGQDVTDTNPETKINNTVTIGKAAKGSQIALFTTNNGIRTDDQESVDAVLNALANKLYYNAYTLGERNLTGIAVGISEGATSSSVQRQADIKFIETTGQGSLDGEAGEGTGINPDSGVDSDGADKGKLEVPLKPVVYPKDGIASNAPIWQTEADITDAINITALTATKKLSNGYVVNIQNNLNGNVSDDILAAAYVVGNANKEFYVDGQRKGTMQLQVTSDEFKPVAIYVNNSTLGNAVRVMQGTLNIVTKTDAVDMLTNAVWVDPTSNGGESLALNANDVNINMIGGLGGNGVAITKSDGTSNSKNGGKITIGGNLNIKGIDDAGNMDWGIGANRINGLSRKNNAGILVDVDFGNVTVNSNANLDIYGNGIVVDAKGAEVTIKKGGNITVPSGTDYGYYTLAAYRGTINMNSGAGANDVKLDGDIFALRGANINLGLATANSQLNGIIDNGGNVNLTLKNGAIWTNVANNTRYEKDNEDIGSNGRSHVTNLKGGTTLENAGNIIQKTDSKNLYIDNLSGTVKVTYEDVDANDPAKIYGGNVTIDKATAGSQIGLYTSNNNISTENVDEVLNVLANKLYYNAYAEKERNLTGIAVGISEGLTSASVKKELQFIKATGQGTINGNGTGANPDSGIEAEDDGYIPSAYLYEINKTVTLNNGLNIVSDGHGITLDGGAKTIVATKGDLNDTYSIAVAKGDTEKSYYALNILKGFASVGIGNFGNSYKRTTVMNTVNVDGDVHIGAAGELVLALLNNKGKFTGAVVNNEGGTMDLQISTDSEWEHVSTNEANKGITSHITNLGIGRNDNGYAQNPNYVTGEFNGAGIIRQTADSGDINVGTLGSVYRSAGGTSWISAGANAKVYYTLDEDNPAVIKGGSVIINSAVEGSQLTLCANYNSNIDKGNLWQVFNGLANKLYYLGYRYKTDEQGYYLGTNNEGANVYRDGEGNVYQDVTNDDGTVERKKVGSIDEGYEFTHLHIDGTGNHLTAFVEVGEGLVKSSITQALTDKGILVDGAISEDIDHIKFADDKLKAGVIFNTTTGQGSLTGKSEDGTGFYQETERISGSLINENGAYALPIYGNIGQDGGYKDIGILKEDGVYNFTDAINVFETENRKIDGGAWHQPVGVAISALGDGNKAIINMNNNDLLITNTTMGSGASISAITGGIVEISNAGNIIINEKGHGPTAGIFANSGGKVLIDNANGGIVTVRTAAGGQNNEVGYQESGACIKTMNGVDNVRSEVIITGLVDLVADLKTCNNEALSAVASTIEVGGGNIQAINGAWAAIRAYGEFVSDNAAIVNVNVLKDGAGNITGAGNNKTTIYGDFVTNGGMGTLGYITIGLNGEDSYWTGNYGDTRGYGVTKGMEGNVTLYMKDGAKWTGFSDGEMNVTMDGEGTTWYGFNVAEREKVEGDINGGLTLTLTNGALWQNAITTEQKYNGTVQEAKVYDFTGNGGFIDMTGNKTFVGKNEANHAEGSNGVSLKNTFIIENDTPQETGNLVITNYSGDTTVIYRSEGTNILGGDTTIKHAEENSNITLSTYNDDIDVADREEVKTVLDNLAHKLFYTGYIGKAEDNLFGKVQIAEGLTSSKVTKYFSSKIAFSEETGQGYRDGDLMKPVTPDEPGDQPGGDNPPVEPEQPGDKPVEPEKPVVPPAEFKDSVDSSNLDNLRNDGTFGVVVPKEPVQSGEDVVLDFSQLDKESAGEKVDNVVVHGTINHSGNNPFIWDMDDKDLSVKGNADNAVASTVTVVGSVYKIQKAGHTTFEASKDSGTALNVSGDASNRGVFTIDNADNNGIARFEAKAFNANGGAVVEVGENADVTVTGKVNITKTKGNVALNVGKGSTVSFGGGVIGNNDGVAIKLHETGKITFNTDGANKVVINGDIHFGDAPIDEENAQPAMFKLRRTALASEASEETTRNWISTKDSKLESFINNTTSKVDFVLGVKEEGKWTGNAVGMNMDIRLDKGGVWEGSYSAANSQGVVVADSALVLEMNDDAEWYNTAEDPTVVSVLKGNGGYVHMNDADDSDIEVTSYSGSTTFLYNNAYGKDVEDDKLIKGGDVTIVAVDTTNAANSNVTLRTNSIGTSDKDEVERVLNALAQKLIADVGARDNLKGKVQIMEGMTTSSAMRTGSIEFDANGKGTYKDGSVENTYTGDYIYGDSETAMMKGAKSAMASTVMMWRSESNDLLQRMGDVRLATEESGVWAKYYGGKYEMDAQNTNFSTSYKAYQVGYDKAVGNGWNVGVAVSHNEGDSRYDRGGEGEMTVTSLSVYGNKDYGDGRYLGLILKGSQLKNEYEVFNNDGYKLEGDFKTWGTSISAEYGKRIEKGNGFYFDPSVELTVGHVQGKDYTATSDMLAAYGKTATMQVEQDDFNSIIGRIGFGIGQRTDKASYYAKLALAHEFGGDFDTHYTAEETKGTNIDFGDTWYEMQLGGTAKLSDNSLLYATYERSFGGDVTEKWRVDAGLRVTF